MKIKINFVRKFSILGKNNHQFQARRHYRGINLDYIGRIRAEEVLTKKSKIDFNQGRIHLARPLARHQIQSPNEREAADHLFSPFSLSASSISSMFLSCSKSFASTFSFSLNQFVLTLKN